MKKIFSVFLVSIIIVASFGFLYVYLNRNPLIRETKQTEAGVEITIKEYTKPYLHSSFLTVVSSYDPVLWGVEILTPPGYPYIYKITNKPDPSLELALWFSEKNLIILKAQNLFVDGSEKEQVLEDYLKLYPSTIKL